MSFNNTLADFVARVHAGCIKKQVVIKVRNSRLTVGVLTCLENEGYISGFVVKGNEIEVSMRYLGEVSAISFIRLVSKPSKRVYMRKKDIEYASKKGKKYIVSSNKGLYINTLVGGKLEVNEGGEIIIEIG